MSMSDREYVENGGNKCPFCESDDVESDDIEVDGPSAWTEDECCDCGQNWTSTYTLTGYVSHDDQTHPKV